MTLLVISAVAMGLFILAELRVAYPMLDLNLFRRPAMTGVSITAFTLAASIFALFLYITFYMQDGLGYGPFAAGVRFLPITVMSFVVAPIAGRLTVKVQSRFPMSIGLGLVALGLLLMATTTPGSGWTQLLPGFLLAGAGIGMVNPVLASSSVAVVPVERSGMGSGANSTFRQIGIATGIAGLGAIFASQIEHRTSTVLNSTAAGQQVLHQGGSALGAALQSGSLREAAAAIPPPARTTLLHAYRIGFSHTFNELMVIGAVVAFAGSLLTLVLVRQTATSSTTWSGRPAGPVRPAGVLPAVIRTPPPSPVGSRRHDHRPAAIPPKRSQAERVAILTACGQRPGFAGRGEGPGPATRRAGQPGHQRGRPAPAHGGGLRQALHGKRGV